MSDVRHLADHAPGHFERFGTDYAQSKLPEVVNFFENCGLSLEHLAILGKHVGDLELVIEDPGVNASTLSVGATQVDGKKVWHRVAVLSRRELGEKKTALESAIKKMDAFQGEIEDGISLNRPVLNWGFYELVADAVGNTVSMQKRYNRYSPDWNGQAYCYLGQYAVSERLFEDAYVDDGNDVSDEEFKTQQLAIRADHNGFKSGVALELLRDNLLLHVTDKVTAANWLIKALRQDYYEKQGILPLTKHEIMARLATVHPTPPSHSLDDFIDRYLDDPSAEDS